MVCEYGEKVEKLLKVIDQKVLYRASVDKFHMTDKILHVLIQDLLKMEGSMDLFIRNGLTVLDFMDFIKKVNVTVQVGLDGKMEMNTQESTIKENERDSEFTDGKMEINGGEAIMLIDSMEWEFIRNKANFL